MPWGSPAAGLRGLLGGDSEACAALGEAAGVSGLFGGDFEAAAVLGEVAGLGGLFGDDSEAPPALGEVAGDCCFSGPSLIFAVQRWMSGIFQGGQEEAGRVLSLAL